MLLEGCHLIGQELSVQIPWMQSEGGDGGLAFGQGMMGMEVEVRDEKEVKSERVKSERVRNEKRDSFNPYNSL